jgi:MFS family permease
LFFAARHETMFLFAAVFGIGLGGEYLIIPLIAAELFGLRMLGRIIGVILTADGVAETVFPMLIGYLRDQMPSACYPLDDFYRNSELGAWLKEIKAQ